MSEEPQPPSDTRELAEVLAKRLELTTGVARLELEYVDGRLVALWKHAKVKATGV